MSFESTKKYGFISSLLMVSIYVVSILLCLSFIPILLGTLDIFVFVIGALIASVYLCAAGLIALILFYLSMYRLSEHYKEPAIFKNVLYSLLLIIGFTIIVSICAAVISMSAVNSSLTETITMDGIYNFIVTYMVITVVSLIVAVFNSILWWRAFTKLGEKSGVDTFKTVGLLYLLGLIPGIGGFLNFIAWIFAAKGFKQLQQPSISTTSSYASTSTFSSVGKIYCSYCGIENADNSIYCKHCGKTLHPTQTNI